MDIKKNKILDKLFSNAIAVIHLTNNDGVKILANNKLAEFVNK